MSWHKEDYLDAGRKAWEHVKEYKLYYGLALAALLLFAAGRATALVTCTGNVPGTLTCVESVTPPVTPPPIDPPPVNSCPTGTTFIRGQWGVNEIYTANYGGGFGGQVIVVEVKVPANWTAGSTRRSTWVEYIDGPTQRQAAFSTKPCSFEAADAMKNGYGSAQVITGAVGFNFEYTQAGTSRWAIKLTPGQTYYINIRNLSCPASCNMRGGLPD